MLRRVARLLLWVVLGPIVLVLMHLLVFRFVPVPLTPLMVIRAIQGEGLEHQWVSLSEMSPHIARAVIAAEDNRFCEHGGVDWNAVWDVVEEYRDDGRLRGASTVSMQTVKNLYFWPGRSVIRKGLEIAIVQALEVLWSKERIMEVYLNIAELGPGVYGVEAAARHHWGVSAGALNFKQSAALTGILPAPRRRDPTQKNRAVGERVRRIQTSISQIGPMLDCVPEPAASIPKRRRTPVPEGGSGVRRESFPVHLQPKQAEGQHQTTPDKPRRTKPKKVRSKRRRRSR